MYVKSIWSLGYTMLSIYTIFNLQSIGPSAPRWTSTALIRPITKWWYTYTLALCSEESGLSLESLARNSICVSKIWQAPIPFDLSYVTLWLKMNYQTSRQRNRVLSIWTGYFFCTDTSFARCSVIFFPSCAPINSTSSQSSLCDCFSFGLCMCFSMI